MSTLLGRWFLVLWPCAGMLAGWLVCQGIIGQYETVWRLNQNQLVAEKMEFFRRIAEAVDDPITELAQLYSDSISDGQLMIVPDNSGTFERKLVQGQAIEWYVEPDGFRRVRAVRSATGRDGELSWLLYSQRVAPVARALYSWAYSFIPLGLAAGVIPSWLGYRRMVQREKVLRSLQGLRNPRRPPLPREEMMELLQGQSMDSEIHRELIALLEQFQDTYTDIQSDAEQSQSVLSAMPVGILAFTSDLRLSFANRAGIDMLELSEPTPVNARLIELIRQPRVIDVVSEAQQSGQTLDGEIDRNDGNTVLRLRAFPLASDPETASRPPMLLILTDETRLRQLENARRDFTANVSHELKTPLAAIKAYTETLLMGAMDDPDAKERFIQRINEQASRLDDLIRDLLQLTKIQSLPERISLSRLHLSEIVRTTIEEHQQIAAKRQVEIVNQVREYDLQVMAEYDALRTILGNLLSNAVRYSKPGGRVEIQARHGNGFVDVTVIDNGIGIPESDLERIFERFYRVDKARSADAGGTGLGLSIVKYLVQALGGSISVRSRLGEGSEFTVRLDEAPKGA
jgi:two-component system phosphate regulon sensor histidine kinase PhoR